MQVSKGRFRDWFYQVHVRERCGLLRVYLYTLRAINSYQLAAKDVYESVKSLKMVKSAIRPLYCDERQANKLRTSVDPELRVAVGPFRFGGRPSALSLVTDTICCAAAASLSCLLYLLPNTIYSLKICLRDFAHCLCPFSSCEVLLISTYSSPQTRADTNE